MMALTVALAVLVGVSLGLLGGGGSILTVPLLAYVGGLDTKQAIASSLLVVGVTSAVGAIAHGRAGRVRWGVALPFGAAAMTGALGGGVVARFIPGTALLIALAVIMLAAGGAMLRGRRTTIACDEAGRVPLVKMAVLGAAVGGLVGAGGGFLLVPALAVLAGLTMAAAVGTSLVVIAMQSFAGLSGHLASGHVDWPMVAMVAMVTAAAVVGALIGARVSGAVDADALRTLFGWFVLLMASVILAQETTPAVGAASASLIMIGVGTYVTCRRTAYCPLRRLIPRVRPAAAA